MSGPDLLGWGPDEPAEPPRPRSAWSERMSAAARRRRWTGLAGTVVVGAAAAVLAFQAGADPEAPPPPPPTGTFALEPPVQAVTEVAFGTDWAYALIAACVGPDDTRQCRYRLARRPLDAAGSWTLTQIQTGPVAGAGGLPRLFVDGDRVTVVDQPTVGNVYTSPDGGKTMTVQGLSAGPPVPAVARGDIVDLALCESCLNRLTLLEPRTGRLRQLAQQPPFDPAIGIRTFARSGDAFWTLGDSGAGLTSAVSVDGGRTWRRLPVGDAAGRVELAFLLADDARGAYLVISRDTDPQVGGEFSELWRIGDPTRPDRARRGDGSPRPSDPAWSTACSCPPAPC